MGYNNGLNGRASFGLGGNISESFHEFYHHKKPETTFVKGLNSGNGTLMRLSPIPIAFHADEQLALKNAK